MKIAIIILNWNGREDTLACLASLEKVAYAPFETIVVDNGSSDGSAHAIKTAYPHITLLENSENLGFAGGNNVGIEHALKGGADRLFLLNNDTVVEPDILSAFAEHFENHPNDGIVGGTPFLFEKRDTLDHVGGMWNPKTARFDLVGNRAPTPPASLALDYACGCALMVKRSVFETVGLLEPSFFLIWEEADLCTRAKKRGFGISFCPRAILYHKVSASFVGGKTHTNYFWWRNRLLWIERNCTRWEKLSLYSRILIPEILHIYKIKKLKQLQNIISPNKKERIDKIQNCRASLAGVKDYLLRRFGPAPPWVYTARR